MPVPETAPATSPHPWLSEYWRAWWTLHPGRPKHGGGMGPPIPAPQPWASVMQWADRHPHLDADLLVHVVAAMDEVFLEHWRVQAKAEAERQRRLDAQQPNRGRRSR